MTIALWVLGGLSLVWIYGFVGRLVFVFARAEEAECYLKWDDDLIGVFWPVFLSQWIPERIAKRLTERERRRRADALKDDAAWQEFISKR